MPRQNDAERSAYNQAFHTLGLPWHWDEATYAALCRTPCERQRLLTYLQTEHPHLLRAYDGGFLADAILSTLRQHQPATPHLPTAHTPS
jgi:hypothetical protein